MSPRQHLVAWWQGMQGMALAVRDGLPHLGPPLKAALAVLWPYIVITGLSFAGVLPTETAINYGVIATLVWLAFGILPWAAGSGRLESL